MKVLLDYIEQKRQNYAQLPFFDYLRDKTISPRQKLAFAPCAAPFVMSFGELNKYAFRDESNPDPLQSIINKHTYQDDHHWIWFLEDLEKLELSPMLSLKEALALLWSEATEPSRRLVFDIYQLTAQATPLQRLVVIESIEATGNTFFAISSSFIRDLEATQNVKYRYFGDFHLKVESGRTHCDVEDKEYIGSIKCTEQERQSLKRVIDQVFTGFTAFTNELLSYATIHPVKCESNQQPQKLGTYLLEAGLISLEQLNAALNAQKSHHVPIGKIISDNGWLKKTTVEYMARQCISSHPIQLIN